MKISARNILKGRVQKIVKGPVSTEVLIELPGGDMIASVITKESAERLQLEVGKEAYAICNHQGDQCDDRHRLRSNAAKGYRCSLFIPYYFKAILI